MSGIGYHKHPVKATNNVVTGSRALNTIYQNTTGRPILVIVSCYATRFNDGEKASFWAYSENVTPPTVVVGGAGLSFTAGVETLEALLDCLVFAVPNGDYYKVDDDKSGAATVILQTWTETTL